MRWSGASATKSRPSLLTLKAKGVAFEHYPGIGELQGDIHVSGDMKMVWFKDPDGNVLH